MDYDTTVSGLLCVVLSWIDGENIAKTEIYCGSIQDSISSVDETPSAPEQGYIEQMQSIGVKVENAVVHPPMIGDNGNWLIWDFESNSYIDSGYPAGGTGGSGEAGKDGGYYIPAVSYEGVLSWQTSASDMPAVPSANIRGPQGEKGETGSDASVTATNIKSALGYTPADADSVNQLSENIPDEIAAEVTEQLADRAQHKPEFANSIEECTDTSKLYVLPDGYIYAYMPTEVQSKPLFTNQLPLAINEDGTEYVGDNGEDGYRNGYRISGSSGTSGGVAGGGEKEAAGYQVTGFIPVLADQVVRIKNTGDLADSNRYCTAYYYGESFAKVAVNTTYMSDISLVDGVYSWTTQTTGLAPEVRYMRITLIGTSADTIITVDEEIAYSAGGTDYAWANTGHAFVPADYEERIIDLEDITAEHTEQIAVLEKAVESGATDESKESAYTRMKRWKYPIYEDAPVFLLETNKAALSGSFENTDAIYAKYDALMAEHAHYITREDCGMASDGTTPIFAYHFAEPEPHKQVTNIYLETKPVILVCSGVHPREIAGVYCMYYAMEEITTNPKLLDIRRNLHIIVMPMINPTAFKDTEYYMRNPDGIQVHYNYEVDFGTNGAVQGDRNYGGESPLSIPETQYFDALMAKYKDTLACVLSCHNNEVDEKYGTGFIWCSCATDYMVNLGNRFIDKMSAAWLDKHGTAFAEGIRWANDYALANAGTGMIFDNVAVQPDWDYRVGRSSASGSGGTEYKQAIKYGVHGANVEVCPRCLVLDRDYNAKYTQNVMTMGAETYINWIRTYMAAYDPKDKKDYAPNLPWEE